MPQRESAPEIDPATAPAPQNTQPSAASAGTPPQATVPPTADARLQGPIPAPAKGEAAAYTIDNVLGYRKEDTADGGSRQIRFADRPDGQKPDDEMLAAVRAKKPAVGWAAKEKAWRAQKTPEGLQALDLADQELRDLGRKRSGGKGVS